MYWIWLILTNPNEYLLDRGLGLVANSTDLFLLDWKDIYHPFPTKEV